MELALEEAGALAERLDMQSANALEAERRALAESRREIEVLTAAAGADKDTALAALKARRVRGAQRSWYCMAP